MQSLGMHAEQLGVTLPAGPRTVVVPSSRPERPMRERAPAPLPCCVWCRYPEERDILEREGVTETNTPIDY